MPQFLIPALLVGGGLGLVAGEQEASAKKKLAKKIGAANVERIEAYRKAQKELNKGIDDILTENEISKLKQDGFINEAEAVQLAELNSTEENVGQTIKDYFAEAKAEFSPEREKEIVDGLVEGGQLERAEYERAKQEGLAAGEDNLKSIFKRLEERGSLRRETIDTALAEGQEFLDTKQAALFEDIVASGIATREELAKIHDYAKDVMGATDQTVASLQPYKELGDRAALSRKVQLGLATAEEKQEFQEKYGSSIQESDAFKFRLEEAEEALKRRQRATGQSLSGPALKAFRDDLVNRMTAEEVERQVGETERALQLGAQTAVQAGQFRQQGTQFAAQLGAGAQQDIARSLQQQQQLQAQAGTQFGLAGANLRQNLTMQELQGQLSDTQLENLAQREYGASAQDLITKFGDATATSLLNTALRKAQTQLQFKQQRSGLATQEGGALANLGLNLGTQRVGVKGQTQLNLSNLEGASAQQRASLRGQQASQGFRTETSIADILAGSQTQQAQLQAQAGLAPLGGLMGGIQLATGLIGGLGGLGGAGAGSTLGGTFNPLSPSQQGQQNLFGLGGG